MNNFFVRNLFCANLKCGCNRVKYKYILLRFYSILANMMTEYVIETSQYNAYSTRLETRDIFIQHLHRESLYLSVVFTGQFAFII